MAVRILGVLLPENKRIEIALTAIYGIGKKQSKRILELASVSGDVRTNKLTTEDVEKIKSLIEKRLQVEGNLRSKIATDIQRLKNVGSYRGFRHSRKLPVRGQRTKTNARTKRGKRVTVGSGRKPATEKT